MVKLGSAIKITVPVHNIPAYNVILPGMVSFRPELDSRFFADPCFKGSSDPSHFMFK